MSSASIPSRPATTAAPASTRTLVSALMAALFGATIVLVTGFAPLEAVHNAVHDARHAAGFPCH